MSEEAIEENTSNPLPKFPITTMPEIPEEIVPEVPKEIMPQVPEIPKETVSEIPEETIKEIIFLLPVKSLLKFRCVRNSWLSFIDSPYCVKTHLSKSTPKIILNTPSGLFSLDINSKNPKTRAETSVLKHYPHSSTFILGSCNGLLLSNHDNKPFTSLEDSRDVVLQNPYTRTFHKIPYLDPTWPGPKHFKCVPEKLVFDLWYDDLNDDYKVFRNCQFYGGGISKEFPVLSQVNVYSLKNESYRQIDPFPYYMKYATDGSVFVGGALHWVVGTKEGDKSQLIASFDVVTEKYRLVEQPVYSSGDFRLCLHVLGGCLCAVRYYPLEHKEVWVMKEYGDVDSWTKIITVSGADVGVELLGYLRPLLYSECGKKVLIERGCKTLLWYDLEKKSAAFVELDMHPVPKHIQAFVHLESLVKLSCRVPNPADEKRGAKDNDENPKKMPKKRDDFLSKGFKLKF